MGKYKQEEKINLKLISIIIYLHRMNPKSYSYVPNSNIWLTLNLRRVAVEKNQYIT